MEWRNLSVRSLRVGLGGGNPTTFKARTSQSHRKGVGTREALHIHGSGRTSRLDGGGEGPAPF